MARRLFGAGLEWSLHFLVERSCFPNVSCSAPLDAISVK